jgi:cytochrome c oxidase subunit 4
MAGEHGHDEGGHIVSLKLLAGILMALLVLTVITVAVSRVDLGELNVWVALGVATVKAALVALFFMHLRWDSLLNSVILIVSMVFVALFLIMSIADSTNYNPELDPKFQQDTIQSDG